MPGNKGAQMIFSRLEDAGSVRNISKNGKKAAEARREESYIFHGPFRSVELFDVRVFDPNFGKCELVRKVIG